MSYYTWKSVYWASLHQTPINRWLIKTLLTDLLTRLPLSLCLIFCILIDRSANEVDLNPMCHRLVPPCATAGTTEAANHNQWINLLLLSTSSQNPPSPISMFVSLPVQVTSSHLRLFVSETINIFEYLPQLIIQSLREP